MTNEPPPPGATLDSLRNVGRDQLAVAEKMYHAILWIVGLSAVALVLGFVAILGGAR